MSAYPDECRGHAERCWAMASQITNPVLRDSFVDLGMHKPLASSSKQEEALQRKALVFVVAYDDAARVGLKRLLESVGLQVVPFRSAVEFLGCALPDTTCCLVLELVMPEMSGLQLQEELAKAALQIPLIFITRHGSISTAVRAMKAGAVDFLTKPVNEQDMLDAVFAALARDRMRRTHEEALSAARERFGSLSPREREVLVRVAAGRLNKQIAEELGVSEIMVKVHRSHGMRKLSANSVAELVRMSDLLRSDLSAHRNAPSSVTGTFFAT